MLHSSFLKVRFCCLGDHILWDVDVLCYFAPKKQLFLTHPQPLLSRLWHKMWPHNCHGHFLALAHCVISDKYCSSCPSGWFAIDQHKDFWLTIQSVKVQVKKCFLWQTLCQLCLSVFLICKMGALVGCLWPAADLGAVDLLVTVSFVLEFLICNNCSGTLSYHAGQPSSVWLRGVIGYGLHPWSIILNLVPPTFP